MSDIKIAIAALLALFFLSFCFHSVLLAKFIESIPDSQLVRQKLGCMCKMVESDLFRQPGRRPRGAEKLPNDFSRKMKGDKKRTEKKALHQHVQVCQVGSIKRKRAV